MVEAFQLIDEEDKGEIDFDNLNNIATMLGEQVHRIINMLNAVDGQINHTE